MSPRLCPYCGRRMIAGRHAVHLSGECRTAWYQRLYPSLSPTAPPPKRMGRPRTFSADDLTPAQIERIMQRRAREQRWERAMLALAHDTTAE